MSQLPSLGVLTAGPQGPAVRAKVPSLCLPSQEQIQARRQRVKGKVKRLLKRKVCVERPMAGKLRERESPTFGKFRYFIIKGQFSVSLSSLRPIILLCQLLVNLSQGPPLGCA